MNEDKKLVFFFVFSKILSIFASQPEKMFGQIPLAIILLFILYAVCDQNNII